MPKCVTRSNVQANEASFALSLKIMDVALPVIKRSFMLESMPGVRKHLPTKELTLEGI